MREYIFKFESLILVINVHLVKAFDSSPTHPLCIQ
jgi:hypothetical protein